MGENLELLSSHGYFQEGRWTFSISARCLTPTGVDVLINILNVMRSVMTEDEQNKIPDKPIECSASDGGTCYWPACHARGCLLMPSKESTDIT